MFTVTLAGLAWSTPDGRALFSDLDLSFGRERVGLVGRNGVGKSTLMRLVAGELEPAAGQVTVVGRIAMLRQSVRPTSSATIADLFDVRSALNRLERAASGEATAEDLAEADWTLEARMEAALARMGLQTPPQTSLTALSGGQRTRAALSALVFADPDVLLLDEPTNDLDTEGRAAVRDLLAGWKGTAIVVSHDRALLEDMDAIVELTSLGAARYGGGWSAYRAQKAAEMAAAQHRLDTAERRLSEVARSAQAAVERQARRDSAGRRKAARGDQPAILLGMMKDRAEKSGGEAARLADQRRARAEEDAAVARSQIEVQHPLAVALPPTGLPPSREVLNLEKVTAGHDHRPPIIRSVSLRLAGPERVALVGPNGSGKTTLLNLVAGRLKPRSGEVHLAVPFAMLDQTLGFLDPNLTILDNFVGLHPQTDENACRAALARFMFRADAALQVVGRLSGGQRLRAGLACVLGGPSPPQLLMLDEPTNHLDGESVGAVEAGLHGYDGAMLVVSHDETFLEAIRIERRISL